MFFCCLACWRERHGADVEVPKAESGTGGGESKVEDLPAPSRGSVDAEERRCFDVRCECPARGVVVQRFKRGVFLVEVPRNEDVVRMPLFVSNCFEDLRAA